LGKSKTDIALNEKMIRFCKEYIACKFNGSQAAINAGYSKKAAKEQASRLLTNANVQNYLSELIERDEKKIGLDISRERTLTEIARIAFQDARQFFDENGNLIPVHQLNDDAAATLAGFDVDEITEYEEGVKKVIGQTKKIKRFDKTKALEMLAKHHKIYTDAPITNNNIKFGYGQEEPV
jgi:phage terminase small subunit